MTDEPVLEVKGLSIARGRETVIRDATFSIHSGDYVGIVGPNGGGKTTLVHGMLGLIPTSRGSIRLFGKPVEDFKDWGRVAYVSQTAINFDDSFPMSVRELVGLGLMDRKTIGRPLRTAQWERVDEALSYMALSDLSGRRIGDLSGGQKQRVFVAKALVRNPDLIFLDEPIAGVDAEAQERFYKKLSDLNAQRGTTILIVSHDISVVFCRMSHVMCVNRDIHLASVMDHADPNDILRNAYGDHFHFVFHQHECSGGFDLGDDGDGHQGGQGHGEGHDHGAGNGEGHDHGGRHDHGDDHGEGPGEESPHDHDASYVPTTKEVSS